MCLSFHGVKEKSRASVISSHFRRQQHCRGLANYFSIHVRRLPAPTSPALIPPSSQFRLQQQYRGIRNYFFTQSRSPAPPLVRFEKVEIEQQSEWIEAQKLALTVDLLAAAKQHLHFLAAVDKNRNLYEGPALDYAIFRYNTCWLPMLAEHLKSTMFEGPLVVPLDCEWVWHCHRLNPVRYKTDCEELYGRILDNFNVVSSVKGNCWKQTEEKWNSLYPDEPYVFDLTKASSAATNEKLLAIEKCSTYDLVSAVKRQSPFYYQVSRPHVNNDVFLKEALDRYKGFLYLIKRNRERSIRCFCVPTYDIDLIWHTHQLHPVSYCKDVNEALGEILEHDDTESDRAKGSKLDVGFSETTKQWEQTFGTRYWKAGAMYRGSEPSPITNVHPQSLGFKSVLYVNTVKRGGHSGGCGGGGCGGDCGGCGGGCGGCGG